MDNTELSNVTAGSLTLGTSGQNITVAGLETNDLSGIGAKAGLTLDTGSGAGDISFVDTDSKMEVALTTSSGTGNFVASAGVSTGNQKLSVTANDFTVGKKINSGEASTTLSVFSTDRNLDLAGGDQGDGADISGAELALVTAKDLTVKTQGSSGAIKTGSGITDANTENITGTFKIASGGDFTSGTDAISTSNILSIAAGGSVDLNGKVTASEGFSSTGTAFDNTGGSITTTDSAITIDHSGAVKVGGALSTGTGNVDIDSTGSTVALNNTIKTTSGPVSYTHLTLPTKA